MTVQTPSVYDVRKTAQAVAWLLIVAILLDVLLSQHRSEPATDPDERPDSAVLTDLDLDAIEDGEERRIRTTGGDTLRLKGEQIEDESEE